SAAAEREIDEGAPAGWPGRQPHGLHQSRAQPPLRRPRIVMIPGVYPRHELVRRALLAPLASPRRIDSGSGGARLSRRGADAAIRRDFRPNRLSQVAQDARPSRFTPARAAWFLPSAIFPLASPIDTTDRQPGRWRSGSSVQARDVMDA